MSVKICHLTSVHGPHDTRIFHKMCRTLSNAGFEVSIVVANAKSETKDKVEIIGVPVSYTSRIVRILKAPRAVYQMAKRLDADIYHLHDPELLPFGVKLEKLGKKVIFDSHEDVPADILDKSWLGPRFFRTLISKIYGRYEKHQINKLSGVISVLDNITNGFHHPNGMTIHNYPIVESFNIAPKTFEKPLSEKFKMVYNGGLTRIRGIHHMIKAMMHLSNDHTLLLMGPWESESYEEECRSIEGWDKVNYLGNVEISECFSILKSCQLGLVLFLPLPNHIQSLPNKSFEYVAAGIPMVMSDFSVWRTFFDSYAHFADPSKPEQIANTISDIRSHYSMEMEKVQEQGKRILDTYTWANEGNRLINYYQKILS